MEVNGGGSIVAAPRSFGRRIPSCLLRVIDPCIETKEPPR